MTLDEAFAAVTAAAEGLPFDKAIIKESRFWSSDWDGCRHTSPSQWTVRVILRPVPHLKDEFHTSALGLDGAVNQMVDALARRKENGLPDVQDQAGEDIPARASVDENEPDKPDDLRARIEGVR